MRSVSPAIVPLPRSTKDARLVSFASALDAVQREVEADLGEEDAEHIRRLARLSRGMEIVGRALIHVSFEPALFSAGVFALAIHKQLEAIDIGHSALHGAYDRVPGAEAFRAEGYVWKNPVSEEGWRYEHNTIHHGFTNVTARDPDIHIGFLRTVESTEHEPRHWVQLPFVCLVLLPNFMTMLNGHVTGVGDHFFGFTRAIKERSTASKRRAHRLAFEKWARYAAVEYGVIPALAGPFFPKVMLGNFIAGTLRDIWGGLTILMTHTSDELDHYDDGAARSRGEYYERLARATQNVTPGTGAALLFGRIVELSTVEYHIEHHIFPRLPLGRLRQVAPRVRAICEAHGVPYRTTGAGKAALGVFARLARLSTKNAPDAPRAGLVARARGIARGLFDRAFTPGGRAAAKSPAAAPPPPASGVRLRADMENAA